MNVLLLLPTDLVCGVLSKWLRLEHVARLDSAFANTETRPVFLESIPRSPCCVVRFPFYDVTASSVLMWLNRRGLRVDRLLSSTFTMNTGKVYMQIFGQSILTVELHEFGNCSSVCSQFITAVSSCCSNLKSMVCVSCKLNASIFNVLLHCSKLENFLLVDCFDEFPGTLPACDFQLPVNTRLKNVAIDIWWKNHQSCLSVISAIQRYISLPHIQRLYVNNNNTRNDSLPLSTLPMWKECGGKLQCLGYQQGLNRGRSDVTLRDFTAFIVSHPSILHLDVSNSSIWTDAGTDTVARYLPQLQSFNVSETTITDTSLFSLAEFCGSTLIELFVSKCANVTGNGFNAVLAHCKQLHTLGIDFMPQVTDAVDTQLLGNISTLQTSWVGNKESNLLKYFHRLENLYIEGYIPYIRDQFHRYERSDPLVLRDDTLPALCKLILCASYRSSYMYSFRDDRCSARLCTRKKTIAELHFQRPHLHIRYEVAMYWPSNLMHLPL